MSASACQLVLASFFKFILHGHVTTHPDLVAITPGGEACLVTAVGTASGAVVGSLLFWGAGICVVDL